MTFFTKYGPAPCDKNCRSEHQMQTLFPRFGEGLGTRLLLSWAWRPGNEANSFPDNLDTIIKYQFTQTLGNCNIPLQRLHYCF